jgi:hypothetical protein
VNWKREEEDANFYLTGVGVCCVHNNLNSQSLNLLPSPLFSSFSSLSMTFKTKKPLSLARWESPRLRETELWGGLCRGRWVVCKWISKLPFYPFDGNIFVVKATAIKFCAEVQNKWLGSEIRVILQWFQVIRWLHSSVMENKPSACNSVKFNWGYDNLEVME